MFILLLTANDPRLVHLWAHHWLQSRDPRSQSGDYHVHRKRQCQTHSRALESPKLCDTPMWCDRPANRKFKRYCCNNVYECKRELRNITICPSLSLSLWFLYFLQFISIYFNWNWLRMGAQRKQQAVTRRKCPCDFRFTHFPYTCCVYRLQSDIKVNFMHDRFLWLIEKIEYELVWDWIEDLWG